MPQNANNPELPDATDHRGENRRAAETIDSQKQLLRTLLDHDLSIVVELAMSTITHDDVTIANGTDTFAATNLAARSRQMIAHIAAIRGHGRDTAWAANYLERKYLNPAMPSEKKMRDVILAEAMQHALLQLKAEGKDDDFLEILGTVAPSVRRAGLLFARSEKATELILLKKEDDKHREEVFNRINELSPDGN